MSLQRFQCTFARTESSGRSVAEIRSKPVTVSIRSIEFHRAQGIRQFQTAHLQPGGVSGGLLVAGIINIPVALLLLYLLRDMLQYAEYNR